METNITYASLASVAKSMMGLLEGLAGKRRKGSVNTELSRLPDHLLDDIGLTRQQVEEQEREQRSA